MIFLYALPFPSSVVGRPDFALRLGRGFYVGLCLLWLAGCVSGALRRIPSLTDAKGIGGKAIAAAGAGRDAGVSKDNGLSRASTKARVEVVGHAGDSEGSGRRRGLGLDGGGGADWRRKGRRDWRQGATKEPFAGRLG